MTSAAKNPKKAKPKGPPATTPEQRENQLISLSVDVAEQQLLDGTASAQVITHFLKLATAREQIEREKLELENQLLRARTEQIGSQAKSEQMYAEAIKAFKSYSGQDGEERYDD